MSHQKKRRSWFQFRLQTLLLIMLVAGPVIYGCCLFGPNLVYRLFPAETELVPFAYYGVRPISGGPEAELEDGFQDMPPAQATETN